MKKKLIISIVSIMSFILLLSGILIFNNKEVKNSSVDKEIKSENQEDTTWQEDYLYKRDKVNNILVLVEYRGNDKDIVIPAKAVIDGVEYRTMPLGDRELRRGLFTNAAEINSLIVEDGVLFPTRFYYLFNSNIKKLKIGNVDLSMMGSFANGFNNPTSSTFVAPEEIDFSNLDTSNLKIIADFIYNKAYLETNKLILGKKVELKKKFNNMETYLIPKSTSGFYIRENTDEVYSGIDLAQHYDGSTMYGTYLDFDGKVLTYYPNGGSGYMVSKKLTNGFKLDKNKFDRYGYTFKGWNTSADGTGENYSDEQVLNSITNNISLYAQWEKNLNEELPTKDVKLNYHMTEENSNIYIDHYIMRYKLKITLDDKTYTEPIKYMIDDTEYTINSNDGIYNIEYSHTINYLKAENGITIKIPENANYEFEFYNNNLGEYAGISENISGTATSNINYDVEVSPSHYDMLLYFLVSDMDKVESFKYSVTADDYGVKNSRTINYSGSKEGTYLTGPRTTILNLNVNDGDIITIHDINTNTSWGVTTSSYTIDGREYKTYLRYDSGYLGYGYPINITVGRFLKDIGTIGIEKKAGTFGVEGDEFNFTVVATNTVTNEPIVGDYPYTIFNKDDEVLSTGKIKFRGDGSVTFKLKGGEKIFIGAAPFGYKKNGYDKYYDINDSTTIYDTEGVLPSTIKYTIYEFVNTNKYQPVSQINKNFSEFTSIDNYRNKCSLDFKKIYKLNNEEMTYISIKDKLNKNYRDNFEEKALDNKYNGDIPENLSNYELYKIYEEYFNILKEDNNEFLQLLSNMTSNLKFKLTLKDGANLSSNDFYYNFYYKTNSIYRRVYLNNDRNNVTINEDGTLSVIFEAPVNYVINDDMETSQHILFENLWCGMEYEIEELNSDIYEHEDINTKGILRYDGSSSYSTSVKTNASIINKNEKKGTLTLKKEIKGDVSSTEEFKFDITLDLKEEDRTEYTYTGSKEGILEFVDGKASITLKGGESITISDLPFGIEYKVVENTEGYKVKKENDTGTIDKETVVTFTNSKEVKKASEIVNTLDGVGKYIAVALVSIIGIITTIYLRKHSLER